MFFSQFCSQMLINLHSCEHGSYSFSHYAAFLRIYLEYADPGGRAVSGVGLRPFAGWDCRLESRRGGGGAWMSVSWVICCHVEVPASSISIVQRSPAECGVSECNREASVMRRLWPTSVSCATGKSEYSCCFLNSCLVRLKELASE